MSSLLEMEDAVDSCSGLLTKRLDEFATAGNVFDLGVSTLVPVFDRIPLYAETATSPSSNIMPSTLSASSLSTRRSASSNKALTWTV